MPHTSCYIRDDRADARDWRGVVLEDRVAALAEPQLELPDHLADEAEREALALQAELKALSLTCNL